MVCVVLERTDLYVSTLGGCGGLERTHWEGMVVLKEEFLTLGGGSGLEKN